MRNLLEDFRKRTFLYVEILILVIVIPLSLKVATDPETRFLFSRAQEEKTARLWLEPQEIRTDAGTQIDFKIKVEMSAETLSPGIKIVLLTESGRLELLPDSLESSIFQIRDIQITPSKVSFKLQGVFSGQATVARFSCRALSSGSTTLEVAPETEVLNEEKKNILEETASAKILIN